jgi:endonuclease YncB( thermonuclease family)
MIKSLGKGKYGRILAVPYTEDELDMCKALVDEGHAVEYWGGKKTAKIRDDGTWGE